MPALALGVGRAALLTRLLRASMLEVIRTEYVTTARAKGLGERPVVFKHALKNALIPTITVMGLQVGFLIGGAIVIETLFAMPGLGTFGIDAIIARDYQQVQGFALLTALAFVIINLLVDLTYTFLDPADPVCLRAHGRPDAPDAAHQRRQPRRGRAPGDRGVAWPAASERAESPFGQGCAGCGAARPPSWAPPSSPSWSSSRSSPTCWRRRARPRRTRPRPSQRPCWDHPLGTDQLGRDMLSRAIHGTRISLLVGVSSVLLALFVGVPLGMIAGYYGGRVDTLVMRVMDLILAFPIYLLAVILMVIFTPTAGLLGTIKVTGAIAIVRIPIYARLVRGSVLSIKEKEYIEACRALGVRIRGSSSATCCRTAWRRSS